MSRELHAFEVPDMSALARGLKRELDLREDKPGHVEILNMLARAAGFRNYQHWRASRAAQQRLTAPAAPAVAVDHARVEMALRCFDEAGVLSRWPARTNLQQLCLWGLWSRVPARRALTEKEVNEVLKAGHGFGDHALLRREMVNRRLLQRTADCKVYHRVEQTPPGDALALLRGLRRDGRD